MKRQLFGCGGDKSAAVAPTVALSLFALIGAGGIAFDYARLASLDTELQNAADQAALAAATQLDQETGAVARATAAAQGLLANQTLMANDGNVANMSINVPTVLFYATKPHAEAANGTDCPTANTVTADATARFVCVRTMDRVARYALTPVAAAFSSGNIAAMAVAGLGSAICKTPPVMICNPQETGGSTSFDATGLVGAGVRLTSVGNGSGTWVPGNFGYLDTNGGGGASALRQALGWTTPPGDCAGGTGVDMKTGANVSVTDALNTRFDIYDGNNSCPTGGACPASVNSVKDVVREAKNSTGGNSCRLHSKGWIEASTGRYLPTSPTTPLPTTTTPYAMGHPRDMCHAVSHDGSCSGGRVGNAAWDRDAYFRVNYQRAGTPPYWGSGTAAGSWRANTGLPANATRYQVYAWEIANRGVTINGVQVLSSRPDPAPTSGSTEVSFSKSVCSVPEGQGAAFVPGGTTPDRRRLSVAVINCIAYNVHGSSDDVPVEKWIEVFLVEPSINRLDGRTNAGDVYVEVIGETDAGAGATAGQVIRRDVPYLVK